MPYVIKRTDQGGGYVAPPGSQRSYTREIRRARAFRKSEDAARNCCPGNEVVVWRDDERYEPE